MVLTFDETCMTLRWLTEQGQITAWNHRVDMHTGLDVWIIDFLPGNAPRCVEWAQTQVEQWLNDRETGLKLLGTIDG